MTMKPQFSVPVVDISSYLRQSTVEERKSTAKAIDEACRSIGFFQIINHGIPADVEKGLIDAVDSFFLQDMDIKMKVYSDTNRGYSPPNSENTSLSLGLESTYGGNDYFEAFNIGSDQEMYQVSGLSELLYEPNTWPPSEGDRVPEGMKRFRVNLERWYEKAAYLSRILIRVFEDALEVPEGTLSQHTKHSMDVLRIINYALPPGTPAIREDEMGMGEHTDYGFLTVLWADRVPGLQILGRDGIWHDLVPEEGALLVNLADMMARITNEQWLSTLHRVKPPVVDGLIQRRRSVAFFHDGDEDAIISTLPKMIDEEHPPLYKPVRLGDHQLAKLRGSKSHVINKQNTEREAARVLASKRT